jgi:hypothetical protein
LGFSAVGSIVATDSSVLIVFNSVFDSASKYLHHRMNAEKERRKRAAVIER